MKRILIALCALVIAGSAALTAEADSDASYSPVFVEEYNYGNFDELGMNKIYQLSPSDDPRLIPTEDFELGGRHYFLLELIRSDEVCADGCGTVTYTAVFGSDKLPKYKGATDPAEAYSDPLDLKSMLIVGVVMLVLVANAMLESRKQAHHPVGAVCSRAAQRK